MKLKYNGLVKLSEECGELIQIAQKKIQFFDREHPVRDRLIEELHEEVADTLATIEYVIAAMNLDSKFINNRKKNKLAKFKSYEDK